MIYPNHEHEKEDKAARRRAEAALDALITSANLIKGALLRDNAGQDYSSVDADNANVLYEYLAKVTKNLAIVGALAEVREWEAAGDQPRIELDLTPAAEGPPWGWPDEGNA